jgi:hypothetical protein
VRDRVAQVSRLAMGTALAALAAGACSGEPAIDRAPPPRDRPAASATRASFMRVLLRPDLGESDLIPSVVPASDRGPWRQVPQIREHAPEEPRRAQ